MEVGGVLYGEKVITMKDSLYIKDEMNSLYAEVVFNPQKRSGVKAIFGEIQENYRFDEIEGAISHNPNLNYKYQRDRLVKGKDYLCSVRGHWTE